METPPIHVLLALDAQILGGEMGHATSTPSSPVVSLVAPDAVRAPTEPTSKFWGVTWNQVLRVWVARYSDANGKHRHIGHFVTEEAAAHAVNAAIGALPPDVQCRRHTNPVVDGQLVPKRRRHA